MMLVYFCEVDEGTKDSGMLKGTYPEKYDLWIHKVPTRRDNTQIRTTSPLSHASDKLSVLFGNHKTESLSVE